MCISQNNEPTNTYIENNKQTRTPTTKQINKVEKTWRKNTTTRKQFKGQKLGRMPLKDKKH